MHHACFEKPLPLGMGSGHGYGAFGMGLGILGMVLHVAVAIGLIYLVVYLVRSFTRHSGQAMWTNHGALGILAERYARGEITEDEYRKMCEILK